MNFSLIIQAYDLIHHCYADDMQLAFLCMPQKSATLKLSVIACINGIVCHMASNRLKLNLANVEVLRCSMSHRLYHINNSVFHIDDRDFVPSIPVWNLGAFVDA